VIIQDEPSSVIWGMPGLVHASGLDDACYPLNKLAGEITRRVLRNRESRGHCEAKRNATLDQTAP
jgi:two-component system, chemotaxis family, protein-glutamate methylesterase/glutaminase